MSRQPGGGTHGEPHRGIEDASLDVFLHALTSTSTARTIVVGAAVSALNPSNIPDAARFVQGLFVRMAAQVGFEPGELADGLGVVDPRTGRLALPLEAFLADCDDVVPGLGTRFAVT